jgi:proton-dependent oligopeptide transporter, POT family
MSSSPTHSTWLGHPRGLFLLFATELWERFNYYGMRALLVLTLVAGVESANPGFGWTQPEALRLYGLFTGFVYFTPLIGGWLADNHLGQRKCVIAGGIVMAAAQFVLAAAIPGNLTLFYFGLVLLVIGNGLFKPNISTMVGELYPKGDARVDSAFTIFYMGINIGALFAPFVCSTLGENPAYGWRYGYAAAGCGMLLSVLIQMLFAPRMLGEIGTVPVAARSRALSGGSHLPLTREETDRLRVIFILFTFVVVFWAGFEQAGGLMNLYASDKTDRLVGGFLVPSGWFQSLNPFFVILLAPLFSLLWVRSSARNSHLPTPSKMALGLVLTSLGFMALVGAVFDQADGDKASLWWLVVAYLLHTAGELCISPVGLALVTRLAPLRLASLMMGVWFLINFFANWLAGIIGSFAESLGELAIFGGLAIALLVFAVLLWLLSPTLVRWMHGAERRLPQ